MMRCNDMYHMTGMQGDLQRKKKKRKNTGRHGGQQDEIEGLESAMQYDSNEPTYCTCKRISFGSMIACDNTEYVIYRTPSPFLWF